MLSDIQISSRKKWTVYRECIKQMWVACNTSQVNHQNGNIGHYFRAFLEWYLFRSQITHLERNYSWLFGLSLLGSKGSALQPTFLLKSDTSQHTYFWLPFLCSNEVWITSIMSQQNTRPFLLDWSFLGSEI